MFLSGTAIVALAAMKPRRNRLFHYITAGVVFVASIAYFTMGSNLGQVRSSTHFEWSSANLTRYRSQSKSSSVVPRLDRSSTFDTSTGSSLLPCFFWTFFLLPARLSRPFSSSSSLTKS